MNYIPRLSEIAMHLDPLNQRERESFLEIFERQIATLDDETRAFLDDKINSSLQMLTLASITSEAPTEYRARLIAAARATERCADEQ